MKSFKHSNMYKIQDIDDYINRFNNLLLLLIENIADVCPNSVIGTQYNTIKSIIINSKNRKKFIELFVEKILRYKDKIDKGDESFFVNKSYDNDVDGDKSVISYVFKLKDVWTQLSKHNKTTVFQYMKILCKMSQDYFMSECSE